MPGYPSRIVQTGQGEKVWRVLGWEISINTLRRARWGIIRRVRLLWVTRRIQMLWWAIRVRANDGVCSIKIANKDVGFFAQMVWCLYIFQYCERRGLIPDIRLKGEIYLDHKRGPNWLHYYFDLNKQMTPEERARRVRYTKKIHQFEQIGLPFAPKLSLDDGARTLDKYLRLKPYICTIVDDFWKTLGVDGPIVGVHFRGTDKSLEAPRVSWEHCLDVLEDYLRNHSAIKAVFVASDEMAFIDFIETSVKDVPVYFRNDHFRSNDGRPVHTALGEGRGYEKGEDALVNALLLSNCAALIRTTSLLSAWASIFNPDLKVIMLNKPYDNNKLWYPETEIFRKGDTEYLPECREGSNPH